MPLTLDSRSRTEKRASFSDKDRIVLLEQDSDTFEAQLLDAIARMNNKLTFVSWVGVSVMLSLIGALFVQVLR